MKNLGFVFLAFFFYSCSAQTQTGGPGETVRKIFVSLKTEDEKAFLALCPDSAQLVRILKKVEENTRAKIKAEQKERQERYKSYLQSSSVTSSDKTDSLVAASLQKNYSPEGIRQMQERYRSCFNFLLEKGKKRGINWNMVVFTGYTLDTSEPNPQTAYFFLDQSGYKAANGIVHFKAGKDAFKMSFGELLFLPEENGWYGGLPYKLARENERLEDDHEGEVRTEIDLANIVVDEPPPPPPPPLLRKPKAKRK